MASEALLAMLKEFEGWSDGPYLCPASKWTIGWGHTGVEVTEDSPKITSAEGLALLVKDVDHAEQRILALCPMLIGEPQARIDAMISWAFNFGPNRVKKTTLEKCIAKKDWSAAARQMERWVYAVVDGSAKKLPGLVRRRAVEAKWMESGSYA